MELSRLPLYDRYVEGLDKKIGSETDEKIKRALEIKKDLLKSSKLMLQERAMELGITDAAAHNMFVRETTEGKPKIVFFDTGLEEGKPHFIND